MAKKISVICLIISWFALAVAFFCLGGFIGSAHGKSKQACYDNCIKVQQEKVRVCLAVELRPSKCVEKAINDKKQCISDCLNNKK